MKKFIKNLIIILLPILIMGIIMEILIRKIPNDYKLKKTYLDLNAPKINTLILGSSHSFYGFDPSQFKNNTFNASHISQSLYFDFEILKKYERNFKSLKTVILPISYFTLFCKMEEEAENWRVKNYTIYYNLKTNSSIFNYSEVLSHPIAKNICRLNSYYIEGNSNLSSTTLGKSENLQFLDKTGEKAAIRHTREALYSDKIQNIFKENKFILNAIIEWCKKRNVKVILFTPPAYKTYIQKLNKKQLNLTLHTANETASKYDNCRYVNLLKDKSFTENDFYDADHLSEPGAQKLSRQIDKLVYNLE